jgi:hypothetical protein
VLRSTRVMSLVATAVAIAALVVVSGALAAKPTRYAGQLWATPNVLHAGEKFTVSGCGYDPDSAVIVGFTGGSWGATPDPVNGCFSVPDIPALSGDTLPPGDYPVSAYQLVRNRWKEVGETTVTVIP